LKLLKFCILFFFISNSIFAQENLIGDIIKKSIKAHDAKDFGTAIKHYNQLLAININSAELYYNLGTAHLEKKDIAESIYYLEKAKKIQPEDTDINKNLSIAYSLQVDDIDKFPEIFLISMLKKISNLFNSNIWFYLAFASFCTCLFCFWYFANLKFRNTASKTGFYNWLLFLFIGLFFLLLSNIKYNSDFGSESAIIFSDQIEILAAPNDNAEEIITIHQGLKVNVIDAVDAWFKIELSDKTKGWIKKSALKVI